MDSLKPVEIVVSFSSLSHWNESAVTATKEEAKAVSKLGVRDTKNDRDSRLGDVPSDVSFAPDAQPNAPGNSCISIWFLYHVPLLTLLHSFLMIYF